MTSDGYCTINEFASMTKHHADTIRYWLKLGRITLPKDRKVIRGKEVFRASDLRSEYERYTSEVEQERQEKEARFEKFVQKTSRKQRKDCKGEWGGIVLEKIDVPANMHERDMVPYRQLGWAMLIDAVLDLASPCMSDKRNKRAEGLELTISRATRWLSGESDPETLSLACQLAGVSERWLKEKIVAVKKYPSRTEMKKMLSEWRASVGQRKQSSESSLSCNTDFGNDSFAAVIESAPKLEPVYAYSRPPTKRRQLQHVGCQV